MDYRDPIKQPNSSINTLKSLFTGQLYAPKFSLCPPEETPPALFALARDKEVVLAFFPNL